MTTRLLEMTLEELWELFPIELTEHRSEWAAQYAQMEARLLGILPSRAVVRISHIGSTAVAGIWAKPIVDVLVEIEEGEEKDVVVRLLERSGFLTMSSEERRASLNAGYTEDGFADEVFHIHLRFAGDNDELYFRDFLNDHPETAKEYEALKLGLWHRFEHDRDGYTQAKGDFVRRVTGAARAAYGNRYSERA